MLSELLLTTIDVTIDVTIDATIDATGDLGVIVLYLILILL